MAVLDGATGVLIDGAWRCDGPAVEVRDKFTQQAVTEIRAGTEAHADAALSSAAAAARRCSPAATATAPCSRPRCFATRRRRARS
jgi:acyl-CoA reductase-like NAD-dependent aldehyde dehydrogenase